MLAPGVSCVCSDVPRPKIRFGCASKMPIADRSESPLMAPTTCGRSFGEPQARMDCVGCIKAGVADMPWALSVIWEARMVSKYDPLRRHLANSAAKTVFMTFAEIEKTLAFKLPKSARQYQAWWANASEYWASVFEGMDIDGPQGIRESDGANCCFRAALICRLVAQTS